MSEVAVRGRRKALDRPCTLALRTCLLRIHRSARNLVLARRVSLSRHGVVGSIGRALPSRLPGCPIRLRGRWVARLLHSRLHRDGLTIRKRLLRRTLRWRTHGTWLGSRPLLTLLKRSGLSRLSRLCRIARATLRVYGIIRPHTRPIVLLSHAIIHPSRRPPTLPIGHDAR